MKRVKRVAVWEPKREEIAFRRMESAMAFKNASTTRTSDPYSD